MIAVISGRTGTTVLVAALMVVGLALRLPGVSERSLWLDEAWRANVVVGPWQGVVDEALGRELGRRPLGPLLFVLALRALARVVGHSAAGLRALPLAASLGAVPLAYLLGRRWGGRGAGLAAAACFAVYPLLVTFGQELKPFAIDVLAVLALLLTADRVASAPDARRPWLGLVLAAALMPAVSHPATLVLPGIAIGLAYRCRGARQLGRWALAHAFAVAALGLWYAAVFVHHEPSAQLVAYWRSAFPPAGGPEAFAAWAGTQILALGRYALGAPLWILAPAALAGYLFTPAWFRLAGAVTLATVLAAAGLGLYPLAADRTSLFLLPFLYLPLAAAAAWLASSAAVTPRRRARIGHLAGLAAALGLLAWPARGSLVPQAGLVREETAPLVAWLAAERQPTDRLYVYYGAVPAFLFYHPESDARITLGGSHRDDPRAYGAELRPLLAPGERLWILFAHVAPARTGGSERDVMLGDLRLYGREIAMRETPGASLHLFEVVRSPRTVRHIRIQPGEPFDPARLHPEPAE